MAYQSKTYSVETIGDHRYLIPRGTLLGSFARSRFDKVARRVFLYELRKLWATNQKPTRSRMK